MAVIGYGALQAPLSPGLCRLGLAARDRMDAFAPAPRSCTRTLGSTWPRRPSAASPKGIGRWPRRSGQAPPSPGASRQDRRRPDEGPGANLVVANGEMGYGAYGRGLALSMKVWSGRRVGAPALVGPRKRSVKPNAGPAKASAPGSEAAAGVLVAAVCVRATAGPGAAPVALIVVLGDGADWIWHAAGALGTARRRTGRDRRYYSCREPCGRSPTHGVLGNSDSADAGQ